MKYIRLVKSSLKGGCDVRLSPRTVIVGPNGAGKSTIVQSLELATSGWVSDMEGRSRVKQSNALARLFLPDVPMHAEAIFADTTDSEEVEDYPLHCQWSMQKGKKPEHEAPFVVRFPVQDLQTVLGGDANTVGAWLEKQVMGDMTKDDLLSALPPAVREEAGKFVARQGKTDLLWLAKAAANEAKNLKSQATRSEKTVDRMTVGIAPPWTSAKREQMQAEYEELSGKSSGVSKVHFDSMKSAADRLRAAIEEAAKKVTPVAAESRQAVAALQRVAKAKALIGQHADCFGIDTCWVCGVGDEEAIRVFVQTLNSIEKEFHAHRDAVRQQEQEAATLASMKVQLEEKEKWLAQAEESGFGDQHYEREARELLNAISADKAAQTAWANADAARKEIAQLRATASKLSLLAKQFKTVGQSLMDKQKSSFEERVNAFLPGEDEVGIDLSSSRLGFMRDGQLHSALSGAEESRMLLALASAQEDGSTPCVLIPQDRGWDRDTLTSVMTALASSPVQVVIMSTVEPEPVEGWSLVKLPE